MKKIERVSRKISREELFFQIIFYLTEKDYFNDFILCINNFLYTYVHNFAIRKLLRRKKTSLKSQFQVFFNNFDNKIPF